MSAKKSLGILAALSLMSGYNPSLGQDFEASDVNIIPHTKRPPNGCKEYFFNSNGEYSTKQMLKSETVFKCFAVNDKNAIRKFNNRNL